MPGLGFPVCLFNDAFMMEIIDNFFVEATILLIKRGSSNKKKRDMDGEKEIVGNTLQKCLV